MSTTANETKQELPDFKWDETGENSFFGIETQETSVIEEVKEEVEKDKKKKPEETTEEKDDKKGDKKEEPAFESFETAAETKEEVIVEEEDDKQFFTSLASEMKQKGVFQFVEVKDTDEVDEEKFFELQEQELELRLDDALEAFMTEVGDGGKAYLKFKKEGGNDADFFKVYAQSSTIPQVDIATEQGQEAILRYYFKNYDDLEDTDINDKLEWLGENGKREYYAKKYQDKILKDDKAAKDALLLQQEEANKKARERRQTFVDDVKTTVDQTEEVKGFKFEKKEKSTLIDFITKPVVKLQNGAYVTELQNAVNNIFQGDKQKLLLFAKLLKDDFDFSQISSKLKTEITKETKSKLSEQKNTTRPKTTPTEKRSLFEYFDK